MAKLTKKDTIRVAELAKLKLTPKEIDKFTPQLAAVVDLMNELNEIDTEGIEPTAQTTNLENVMRVDAIDAIKCLPQDGFFEVPQILHK